MTTTTTIERKTTLAPAAALGAVASVATLGAVLLFLAGHAQSATLHDAAHDTRHATGFPCH